MTTTIGEQLAQIRARIQREHPRLGYPTVWRRAREALGLCVDCGAPADRILAKRCRTHLAIDAKRAIKRVRAKRRKAKR